MSLKQYSTPMVGKEAEDAVCLVLEEQGRILTAKQISALLEVPKDSGAWARRVADRLAREGALVRHKSETGMVTYEFKRVPLRGIQTRMKEVL